jgi:hypothetical protein
VNTFEKKSENNKMIVFLYYKFILFFVFILYFLVFYNYDITNKSKVGHLIGF